MPVTIGGSGPITGVTSINTTVSDTELGYLDGVTSALQTQINAKANDSSQGLYLITPTSIANSGGSASASGGAVTFTTVTSISLNGVFSSTYDNYRIVVNVTAAGSSADVQMRLRASGSDTSAGYYYGMNFADFGGSGGYLSGSNQNQFATAYAPSAATSLVCDLISPNLAQITRIHYQALNAGTSGNARSGGGLLNNSTVYDGLTLLGPSSLSGIARIYGYRNS